MSASKQFSSEGGSFFSLNAPYDRLEESPRIKRLRERLREITEGDGKGTGRIEQILHLGAEWLEVQSGHLSQIDPAEGIYEITATGGPDPAVSVGEAMNLSSTYCRTVIAEGKALRIENAPEQGWEKDSAYHTFGFSTYLGAKVVVQGRLYGTVCFADREPSGERFDQSDVAGFALIIRAIEEELEGRPHANLLERERLPFEGIFEKSPDMVAVYDLDGRLLATNSRLREQTGYDASALAEMRASDLDEAIEPGAPPWREMDPGERRQMEGRYRRTEGSTIPVEVSLRRLDLNGTGHVVATARNVSGRKQRGRQLDAIVSNTSNPIYIKDRDGRYQFVNEAASNLFDAEPPEVIGKTDEELLHPESAADIRAEDEHVMETGESFTNEGVRLVGGAEHVYLDNKYPYRDEDGEIVGVIGISYDITKRKEQQRKLRDAKDLLETTFESLQEAVVVVDGSDRKIILCNGATEEIFGFEKEELIGADTEKLHLDAEAYQHFGEVSERALNEKGVFTGEYRMRRKDGRVIETEHTVTPLNSEKWPGAVVSVIRDVTERKERERRYQAIFNQTYQFTGLLEPDGTLIEANDTALEFGGVSEEDVLGKPVWETYWFDVGEKTKERLRESVRRAARGEFVRYELEVQGTEERRIIDFSLRPIENEDGEVELIIPEGRDITEQKRAEENLREERDLLERIFEVSPTAIVLFNREGDFVRASDRAEDVLGLSKEDVTDRTYDDPAWDITTADGESIPDEELPFAQVISTEEPIYDAEHTIVWPGGDRRLLSVSGAPLYTAGDKLEGAVFHIEDITERRKAQRALRESEQRFRKLFEEAPIGMTRVSRSGELLETNEAFQRILGYDARDLRERHFEKLTYEEDIGKAQAEFKELVAGGRPRFTIEKRYQRRNGEVFWARLTASLFQHEGETQVIGMVEDIDDQKRYEERLRKAKKAAEEANRMKSAFLANMSHEIRTPLTSIIGFAEAIGEKIGDEEGMAGQFARLIESSGHRLMATLDGVLNLSKLEAGEMDLSLGPVDVAREVEAMAEEFGPQADKAGVDLCVKPTGEPVWAKADDQALQIVLRNLVSNAIKYAGEGGTVTVRTYADEEAIALEVEDDGIGIASEKVERLFEPFRQESEGWGRTYEGTGLGLTVTKKAVEKMRGSIEVETEKGEGSRFTVWLSRAEGEHGGQK